jgi:hypothetical protein
MNITKYAKVYLPNEPIHVHFHDFISELTQPNELIAKLRAETNKVRKDAIKKELHGYCFNGTFGNRSNGGLIEHSGMAILDFDKFKDQSELTKSFIEVTTLPFILAAWRSPSNDGFKALLKIPKSNVKEHELRVRTFAEYYSNPNLDLDADVCRFCFTSYDANPYINESCEEFTLMFDESYFEKQHEEERIITNAITDEDKIVNIISRFKRSTSFVQGERNKHTFNIASQFCEYGVSKAKCIDYLEHHVWSADFKEEGIKAVNSAYKVRKPGTKKLELREKQSFPYEVFPEKIRESLFDVAKELSLNPIFLATAGLWTVSSLAGNAYTSDFGGQGKNILFCMLIAPVSVGKTPAYKAMCEQPLDELLKREDADYKARLEEWNSERTAALVDKKQFTKPKPRRFHPFAKDGTTEGYIALCQDQPNGMGVYHDEAETILNAGAHKSNNDAISFFTQAFSGGRYTQIRADRDKERVVQNLNINLLMGTQTNRLSNIFTMDKIESGFASRFLMVESEYLELNINADPFAKSRTMCAEWVNLVCTLYDVSKTNSLSDNLEPIKIVITDEAKTLYSKYYKGSLIEANKRINNRIEGYIIGAEAKMSAYFPRLTQTIAIINNPLKPIIDDNTVELGWKLYRFYAESTVSIIKSLHATVETGLPLELDNLYNALPEEFEYKQAEEVCKRINLPDKRFRTALRRKDFKNLFVKKEQGIYKKVH